MKAAIIYHRNEPTWRHLVDLESATIIKYKPTGEIENRGGNQVHYMCAVGLQDLRPGQLRISVFSLGVRRPDPDGSYPEPASGLTKGSVGIWRHGMGTPMPCVYAETNPHERKTFVDVYGGKQAPDGIVKSAAEAMLRLAVSFTDPRVSHARKTWDFNGPAKERVESPWDDWKFLTAWMWSTWELSLQPPTIRDRWKEMKALGYPHGERAFSTMVKRLFSESHELDHE